MGFKFFLNLRKEYLYTFSFVSPKTLLCFRFRVRVRFVEIHFRSNEFSSKCRSANSQHIL